MDLTDEQAELLIALVGRFPDVGNAALMQNTIVNAFAVHLHWDTETTTRVYGELRRLGAIHSPAPPYDFITIDAQKVAMKLMKERHHKGLETVFHIEESKRRRELKMVLLGAIAGAFIGGVISFGIGLLTAYLIHEAGWNK